MTAAFGGDGGWRRALSGGGKELGVGVSLCEPVDGHEGFAVK